MVLSGYPKNEKCELIVDNKRNGYTPKTVKSQYGGTKLDIPRDISGIEEKAISLYARSKGAAGSIPSRPGTSYVLLI